MMELLTSYPTEELAAPTPTYAAQHPASHDDVDTACAQTCQTIAPAGPLDYAIVVSPHWARIDMPMRRVAARIATLGDIQVLPGRNRQLQA